MRLAAAAAGFLDLLLPAGCVCCGTWMPGGNPVLVCPACTLRLPTAPWPRCPRCHHPTGTGRRPAPECRMCAPWPEALARARSAHVLAPPADRVVHALKYEGWAALASEMGRAMARVLRPRPHRSEAIAVPVPTTRARIRARGYNQAGLLAKEVAASLGIDVAEGLVRTRGGATQVALHPSQRRANVRGVFSVRDEGLSRLRGAHVILVDDVLTTGATGGAAAEELVRAGVAQVTLLTYARALPFRRADGG